MERCNYNNAPLYADEVVRNFELEKQIRAAGSEDKLTCHGCNKPVIYKRGEIKKPYFAHKMGNDPCEYGEYSKFFDARSKIAKGIKDQLFVHFKTHYPDYHVTKDEKLIEHHWTDISINSKDQTKTFAIEIDDKTMSQKKLQDKIDQYNDKGIVFDIFIIDDVKDIEEDAKAYYIKRKQLNDSYYNMTFVIDQRTGSSF